MVSKFQYPPEQSCRDGFNRLLLSIEHQIMENTKLEANFLQDIENIGKIPIVSTMLDVICRTTGMGFSAIARVTEDRWITCSVRDDIGFGLKPGDELELKTTICDEIRQSGKAVIIDHVSNDAHFKDHHTPAMYGFESYISIPVFRKDGTFFGTLCAIDPNPHEVSNPAVTGMFYLFAELIAFHLEAIEKMNQSQLELEQERLAKEKLEQKLAEHAKEIEQSYAALEKMNKELQSFAYISSHDLQEPLRKIRTFVSIIEEKEIQNLSESGKAYFKRMQNAAERMQILIKDLLTYSRAGIDEKHLQTADLKAIIDDVKDDLKEELEQKNASVILENVGHAQVITFQFRQLLYNLLSNALKFSHAEKNPEITISCKISHDEFGDRRLSATSMWYQITVSDNGIGFDPQYSEKIFGLFQRLHHKTEYEGTGIGLAIVKKIVENHQGHIVAYGQLNQGATFDIFIPHSAIDQ